MAHAGGDVARHAALGVRPRQLNVVLGYVHGPAALDDAWLHAKVVLAPGLGQAHGRFFRRYHGFSCVALPPALLRLRRLLPSYDFCI